jgi:hypothetical protein
LLKWLVFQLTNTEDYFYALVEYIQQQEDDEISGFEWLKFNLDRKPVFVN